MEDRLQYFLLTARATVTALAIVMLTAMAVPARADDAADAEAPGAGIIPKVDRRVVDISKVRSQDVELGISGGMLSVEDFGTSGLVVAALTYHVTEDVFVEARYGRSKAGLSSFERLSGSATLLTDSQRKIGFYDLSLGANLLPGETFIWSKRALNSTLYLIGGIGATRFAGNQAFTVNAGLGYRLVVADFMALHLQVRDHLFNTEITGIRKTTNNIEVSSGFSIFF